MASSLSTSRPLYRRLQFELIALSLLVLLVGFAAGLKQRPYADPLLHTPGFLAQLLFPIERNPHLRAQELPNFSAVAFTEDGRIGLAVGENGTVLKSTNAGVSWTARPSGTSATLYAVDISATGQTAWTVGDAGTILRSLDGGNTWTLRMVDTNATLHSVAFGPDERTGWAAGTDGTVLHSMDGGASWATTTMPEFGEFRSVASGSRGKYVWAVGTNGTIIDVLQNDEWITWHSGSPPLYAVSLAADGRTGWAVGANATLRRFEANNWTAALSIVADSDSLLSLAAGAQGQNVVAVGTRGIIVASADTGHNWSRANLDTGQTLTSVAGSADGRNFWAVGASGTIVYSPDGGMNWYACQYVSYPAVWAWLLVLGSAMATLVLLLQPRRDPDFIDSETMEAFTSDQPITSAGQDFLQRRSLPLALSQLLQNPATVPPLTIAVTGEWGEGKTSLMRLLTSYMKGHARVVWFNAWHHRQEQHLFAALLEAVRDQAVPTGFGWDSVRFRIKLLRSRLCRHPLWATLILGSVAAANYYLPEKCPSATLVVRGLSVLPIANAVRSWVPSAGRLLAVAGRSLVVPTFGAQLAFRHRFAKALGEVSDALVPAKLFIAIDDLDRCQPEQVVETLEAVNFLANAVGCYVVMGFARPQVLGCVGLGFADIASELTVVRALQNGDVRDMEGRSRRARLEYAERYLEKLINVELRVPKLQDHSARHLMHRTGGRWRSRVTKVPLRQTLALPLCLAALLAVFITIAHISLGGPPADGLAVPTTENPTAEESPNLGAVPAGVQNPRQATSESQPPEGGLPANQPVSPPPPVPNDSNAGRSMWLTLVGGIAAVLAAIIAVVARRGRARPKSAMVEDSPEFRKALDIWQGVVRARVNSPRQLKNFLNRVRFLVRLEAPAGRETALKDELVVALGALHSLAARLNRAGTERAQFPPGLANILSERGRTDASGVVAKWVTQLRGVPAAHDDQRNVQSTMSKEVVELAVKAICAHRTEFSGHVTQEMVATFNDLADVVVFR